MKQFDDNLCTNCGGSGSDLSGVEYMGAHEMIGCGWCCGTGWDDINLGVERLRTEIAELRTQTRPLTDWAAAIKSMEEIHDDRTLTDDERNIAWQCIESVREVPVHQSAMQRMSLCPLCGRLQESDPASKYFYALPDHEFDHDWDGCHKGMGN